MKGIPLLALVAISCCGGDTFHHRGVVAFSSAPSPSRPTVPLDDAPASPPRREALHGIASAIALSSAPFVAPQPARAAAGAPSVSPPPLRTSSGGAVRVEEVGGGLDLLSPPKLASSDVFFPSSMIDTRWKVQRVVTSVEGDLGQAALIWKLLGGPSDDRAFASRSTESYDSRFVAAPAAMEDAIYEYEGKTLRAATLDRKYELSSRAFGGGAAASEGGGAVRWDDESGNAAIHYARGDSNGDAVSLAVVRRKIEPPSESGVGSDEVYRIESSAGGIFGGTNVYRAARVRRRYRRGFDEATGRRTLEGIEIVTTHRVLDGIAGMELPTSTCKSRLRYTQM